MLTVLFDYISLSFSFFLGGGMLVQASAFGCWLHRLPRVYMFFLCLFSNFLFVFCDLVYLINLI